MDTRTEIYMAAAEAIGRQQEFLASSARPDLTDHDRAELLRASSGPLNRVYLIAGDAALAAFSKLDDCFVRNSLKLEQGRVRVRDARMTLAGEEQRFQEICERLHEAGATAKALARKGDFASADQFRSDGELLSKRAREKLSDIDTQREFVRLVEASQSLSAVQGFVEFFELLEPAIAAVREELGQEFDRERFSARRTEQVQRFKEEIHAWRSQHLEKREPSSRGEES